MNDPMEKAYRKDLRDEAEATLHEPYAARNWARRCIHYLNKLENCEHHLEAAHKRNRELHEESEALAARERKWMEIGKLLVNGKAIWARQQATMFLKEAYEMEPDG